jgi:hypothetical protein
MIRNFTEHAANERTFLAWVRTGIPCYCFCILGDPAERLKGIQQGGRRTRAGSGRPQCPRPLDAEQQVYSALT